MGAGSWRSDLFDQLMLVQRSEPVDWWTPDRAGRADSGPLASPALLMSSSLAQQLQRVRAQIVLVLAYPTWSLSRCMSGVCPLPLALSRLAGQVRFRVAV
jgi:hypothetical protein